VSQQSVQVEEIQLGDGEKVDVLISEPMGTMLLNERMIESYESAPSMSAVLVVHLCCARPRHTPSQQSNATVTERQWTASPA
jgi:hypothetical protein